MTLQEKAIAASNKRSELAADCNTKWMPLTSDDDEELLPYEPNKNEIKVKWNENRPSDEPDKINPAHYQQGKIEVIDFILDQKMDYLTATIIKYTSRWRFKDGECDLKKARWFLDKLIEQEEK